MISHALQIRFSITSIQSLRTKFLRSTPDVTLPTYSEVSDLLTPASTPPVSQPPEMPDHGGKGYLHHLPHHHGLDRKDDEEYRHGIPLKHFDRMSDYRTMQHGNYLLHNYHFHYVGVHHRTGRANHKMLCTPLPASLTPLQPAMVSAVELWRDIWGLQTVISFKSW